ARYCCRMAHGLYTLISSALFILIFFFFFKQKTAYEIGLGIPAEPLFRSLITFLKASHSFRNRLLVICKNAYLFATMIMTSVSSPFSCCSGIVRLNLM